MNRSPDPDPYLSVLEVAEQLGFSDQTIVNWIREGKLRARKVGTQHVIEEQDLEAIEAPDMLPLPKGWEKTFWGEPMPNVAAWIRESRAGH